MWWRKLGAQVSIAKPGETIIDREVQRAGAHWPHGAKTDATRS